MEPTDILGNGKIRLYLADCLDVMRDMPNGCVDCVVTDPPYFGLKGGVSSTYGGVAVQTNATITLGDVWGSNLEALAHIRRIARSGALVFCSWHCVGEIRDILDGIPVGLLTWYKRNSQPSLRNRPWYRTEFIWAIEYGTGMNWKPLTTMYDIPGLPAGCMATERVLGKNTKKAAHPTQKPLSLIVQLLKACNTIILDPFMGTGTTGVACVQMERQFIGVEIDAGYYEIAKKRIIDALAQPMLPMSNVAEDIVEQDKLL